mmetsp:Transcript_10319/g.33835  ORF Transcript_10319/g.33835 Transcript_10319/m.33835 type:complete len:235 (-) Transcript_10319:5178-5882(-)
MRTTTISWTVMGVRFAQMSDLDITLGFSKSGFQQCGEVQPKLPHPGGRRPLSSLQALRRRPLPEGERDVSFDAVRDVGAQDVDGCRHVPVERAAVLRLEEPPHLVARARLLRLFCSLVRHLLVCLLVRHVDVVQDLEVGELGRQVGAAVGAEVARGGVRVAVPELLRLVGVLRVEAAKHGTQAAVPRLGLLRLALGMLHELVVDAVELRGAMLRDLDYLARSLLLDVVDDRTPR